MVSMNDVAREAGVAKSTVSRILNGGGNFCPETCRKVLDTCEKLKYKLNPNIQDLVLKGRNGATRNIAIIIVEATFANQAYANWIDAISTEVCNRHYHLMLIKLSGKEQSVYEFPSILRDERVDGILITGTLNASLLKILHTLNIPIIVLGTYAPEVIAGSGNVDIEIDKMLYLTLSQFKQRGIRRIAYVDEGQKFFFDQMVFAYFCSNLKKLNLEFSPNRCFFGNGVGKGMLKTMQPLFAGGELPFDGIFCPDLRIAREMFALDLARRGFRETTKNLQLATMLKPEAPELPDDTIFFDIDYSGIATRTLDLMISLITRKSPTG